MDITVHVFHHFAPHADEANPLFKQILSKLEKAMATLDDVVAKVAASHHGR
jgi:hypothetical protein